ncbi:hypothetical protein ACLB2K_065202 [Fragaria x ananassa]
MSLYFDNKAAVEIVHNPVQHDRMKDVQIDKHFIKEKLDRQIIAVPFVPTEEQLVDIPTKTVSSKTFYDSFDKLGICDMYAPTWERVLA